jgi:hypothetical protein
MLVVGGKDEYSWATATSSTRPTPSAAFGN